uniref:Chitin synthase n=1 Tax=Gongylonema pulchrum TaxID=637853 RepID=A0A183D9H1_9BILA
LPDCRHWKCNICYRVNDLPDDFSWDPATKSFGDPTRRPEIRNASVEFIAPSEYMLRPPQRAMYVFVMDVSQNAIETGLSSLTCIISELYEFCDAFWGFESNAALCLSKAMNSLLQILLL